MSRFQNVQVTGQGKALREGTATHVATCRSRLRIVILGLSITSSWGNGHATTYRGLVRELDAMGHDVLFLERETAWYAANRDLPNPPYGRTELYASLRELKRRFAAEVRAADLVIVGSYVPEGIAVGEWIMAQAQGAKAFYDIDTPVTLVRLERNDAAYLTASLVGAYDLYLSFTGGPVLGRIEEEYGSPMARPLYCSVDPELYSAEAVEMRWDLGYMGTYSKDRQASLARLLIEPARRWPKGRFAVAGPMYPPEIKWPANVARIQHLSPAGHRGFYNSQQFTLNVTRADMIEAGYSPSVRLFEAAACAAPIITDWWPGLDTFFKAGEEILIARSSQNVLRFIKQMPEAERVEIGRRARARVLAEHTARHRALELLSYAAQLLGNGATS
jgi:spore maturation protein CgeB